MSKRNRKDRERKEKRKKDEERKKQRERSRLRTIQLLERRHPRRLWMDRKRRRRKRDCALGMPFIIAFHGDPAQTYFCADYPSSFELIPRTGKFRGGFSRLAHYMRHHVTSLYKKVLIYKAGRWNCRWSIKKCFKLSYILLGFAFVVTIYKLLESAFNYNLGTSFVFMLMLIACLTAGFYIKAFWKYYTE